VRYFYNAQLIETTQDARVVFYHSQFSCHNAKFVLADCGDNGQVLIGQRLKPAAPPHVLPSRFPTLEGFRTTAPAPAHRRDGSPSETLHITRHLASVDMSQTCPQATSNSDYCEPAFGSLRPLIAKHICERHRSASARALPLERSQTMR
jgi:hypothetical protein